LPAIRILANENISPKTIHLLNSVGLDAKRITEYGKGFKDNEIVAITLREKRIILTFDLDFGEMFYRSGEGKYGVWVLRMKPQTVEEAERVLTRFIKSETFSEIDHYHTLVILSKTKIRLRYSLSK